MLARIRLQPVPPSTSVNELVDLVATRGKLPRNRIGRVQQSHDVAVIEVPADTAVKLVAALDGARWNQRVLRAALVDPAAAAAQDRRSEDHFARLARLLDLESKAEAQRAVDRGRKLSRQQAEETGNTLVDLVVGDEDAGLGGRVLVRLLRRNRAPLPWTRLDTGSPVVLTPDEPHANARPARGVLSQRDRNSIQVAFDELPEALPEYRVWRVDLAFDEVAIDRQRQALAQARELKTGPRVRLREVLLGELPADFGRLWPEAALNPELNDSQLEAVCFAMAARDVALIHGPPGTGKTTAVVEVIRRAARHGHKVLACAPSNTAVDNIFERLLAAGEQVVRVGHPARVLPELRSHTLDLLVQRHPDVHLARKMTKQAVQLFHQAGRFTRSRSSGQARRELREEARALLADARRLEAQAVAHVLDSASVVCATTTGIDSAILGQRQFDLGVIDEACQSTEPGCWIPLLRCRRLVLAGDHCQLPPTIISPEAAAEGFGVSLFERLMKAAGDELSRQLTVQYRMHDSIMRFSSAEFYAGSLVADESVVAHQLSDLPDVAANPLTQQPLEFIDTAGAGYDEQLDPDGESRMNPGEGQVLFAQVRRLLDAGVAPRQLAVIAPYSAQVRHLRSLLEVEGLEIDSVDGFQGREKEAVVISLVRSNPRGEIGFLADVRRMNVALTRARRKLLLIGDSATLSHHPFYARLLEHIENHGAYRSVWETTAGT